MGLVVYFVKHKQACWPPGMTEESRQVVYIMRVSTPKYQWMENDLELYYMGVSTRNHHLVQFDENYTQPQFDENYTLVQLDENYTWKKFDETNLRLYMFFSN